MKKITNIQIVQKLARLSDVEIFDIWSQIKTTIEHTKKLSSEEDI